MKKNVFLLLFLFSSISTFSINLKVEIFSMVKSSSYIILPGFGNYEVYGNGKKIMDLVPGSFVNLKVENNKISMHNFDKQYGAYSSLKFIATNPNCVFKIKSIAPATDTYSFDDNLELILIHGYIRPINNVNIEDYVAGVVEAEAGKNMPFEFLKLQAIICRTYALGLTNRHPKEGYQMCDNVHCQVYKGKSRFNENIVAAVAETKGKVIADEKFQLITAAFHSNCGGETVNSEDVWSIYLPYLRAVKDTFCYKMPHAFWEKKIPVYDWNNYLSMKNKKALYAPATPRDSFNYNSKDRKVNYAYSSLQVPLKNVRTDWGLRSTYFNIIERNDSVVLKGTGFGHGVGMCQEGAMRMAELGYSYKDIINFYYKDVGVINLENLKFFKED